MFRAAGDVLGRSLLTDDGPGYRRQRRIVQPLFTARQVGRYAPLMAQEALRAADGLARGDLALAADRVGPDGAVVDLHLLAMRYTLRVVGRTLFGDDVERLVPVLDAPGARGRATRSGGAGCRWCRCRCGGPRCATAGPDGCTGSCRPWWRASSRAPHAPASATAGTTSSAGCTTPPTPPVRCPRPGGRSGQPLRW